MPTSVVQHVNKPPVVRDRVITLATRVYHTLTLNGTGELPRQSVQE